MCDTRVYVQEEAPAGKRLKQRTGQMQSIKEWKNKITQHSLSGSYKLLGYTDSVYGAQVIKYSCYLHASGSPSLPAGVDFNILELCS